MWGGTKAIVINTDGSGHVTPLRGTGDERFIPRFDDPTKNALTVSDYMGTGGVNCSNRRIESPEHA